jgi:hypothetical protein
VAKSTNNLQLITPCFLAVFGRSVHECVGSETFCEVPFGASRVTFFIGWARYETLAVFRRLFSQIHGFPHLVRLQGPCSIYGSHEFGIRQNFARESGDFPMLCI